MRNEDGTDSRLGVFHSLDERSLQGVQMPATVENWSLPGNFGVDLIGNQRGISLKKDLMESDRAAEE